MADNSLCLQDNNATPLLVASENGHEAIVRVLVSSRAIVNDSHSVSGDSNDRSNAEMPFEVETRAPSNFSS